MSFANAKRAEPDDAFLPKPLLVFLLATLALALVSAAYTLTMADVFQRPYPFGLPYFGGLRPFTDFTIFDERFAHLRSPMFWQPFKFPFTYPAPLAAVFALFFSLPDPLASYLSVCLAAVFIGGLALFRQLRVVRCSAWASLLFTIGITLPCWPWAFLIARANIEGIGAIILAIGIIEIMSDRNWTGSTCIGVAASMKLFPIILLALLISKRKYKECGLGVVVFCVVTLASLAFLGPSVGEAGRHIASGLAFFQHNYAEQSGFLEFDHSLFALFKALYIGFGHNEGSFIASLKIYTPITMIGGVLLYTGGIRRLPLLNQVIALSACSILLPPVSFDYTLVHLLVPCGLLCVYAAEADRCGLQTKGLAQALLCFAVIFTWGTFLTLEHRIAGQVRAVALLALLYVVLRYPFPSRATQMSVRLHGDAIAQ